jgi:hypothetical protein
MRRFIPFALLLLAGCSSDPASGRMSLASWTSGPSGKAADSKQPGRPSPDEDPSSSETDEETSIRKQNEARDVYQDAGYPH